MKIDIRSSYMTKFEEIKIGSEFIYEGKKYCKLKTFTFEVKDGLNYCVNAIVLDSSPTYGLIHFSNSTDVEISVEPVLVNFKDLNAGDIFIHNRIVIMKIQPTTQYRYNNGNINPETINSMNLSEGCLYRRFDDDDSVEKIVDYDFKITRR